MSFRPAPLGLLLALLLASTPAHAHGTVEASELEVELLADETTDAVYATGGYDVAQVFLGEAHVPSLGAGEAGDGIYFRGEFAGRPSPEGASRIVFAFEAPAGRVERTITIDGAGVTSDFDLLLHEPSTDALSVQRAFLTYAAAGVAPGDTLTGFTVNTYSGARQVDVAPGGLYAGPLTLPAGESTIVTPEVVLGGTGGYLDVVATREGDATLLTVTSLLKKGGQHLDLAIEGSTLQVDGPASVSVGPQGIAEFRVRASAPTFLDVTTDVGGRERVEIGVAGLGQAARDVPGPGLVVALSVLALLAFARRP